MAYDSQARPAGYHDTPPNGPNATIALGRSRPVRVLIKRERRKRFDHPGAIGSPAVTSIAKRPCQSAFTTMSNLSSRSESADDPATRQGPVIESTGFTAVMLTRGLKVMCLSHLTASPKQSATH